MLFPFLFPSVNAKIRAIEAKLQMMEENPDDYSGPSAYTYNKPPDKREKRSQPYHKHFRKHRRWPLQKLAKCRCTERTEMCADKMFLSLGQCETIMYYANKQLNTFDL